MLTIECSSLKNSTLLESVYTILAHHNLELGVKIRNAYLRFFSSIKNIQMHVAYVYCISTIVLYCTNMHDRKM